MQTAVTLKNSRSTSSVSYSGYGGACRGKGWVALQRTHALSVPSYTRRQREIRHRSSARRGCPDICGPLYRKGQNFPVGKVIRRCSTLYPIPISQGGLYPATFASSRAVVPRTRTTKEMIGLEAATVEAKLVRTRLADPVVSTLLLILREPICARKSQRLSPQNLVPANITVKRRIAHARDSAELRPYRWKRPTSTPFPRM